MEVIGTPCTMGLPTDGRGSRARMSPPEGHETQGPQNKEDFEARGEPPKGRPLPTLREIHQMNLRRALEEEMAEVPCDICGSQDHDYRHFQAGALPESQTPGILQAGRVDNQGSL